MMAFALIRIHSDIHHPVKIILFKNQHDLDTFSYL